MFGETLHRVIRGVRTRLQKGPVILAYHRVAKPRSDPWSLAVSPEHFAEHLEVLGRHFRPMSLKALCATLNEGSVPADAVVVTFDDGYADNLHVARPLLEQAGVPATVFVTTGALGEREFWWDRLSRLLLEGPPPTSDLHLSIADSSHQWKLDSMTSAEMDRARRWRYPSPPATAIERAYIEIWQLLRQVSTAHRAHILEEIETWRGSAAESLVSDLVLTPDEVVRLAEDDLVEIGAHTVTHPQLSGMSLLDQQYEVAESRRYLEALLNRRVEHFSYPFGDFTADTVQVVKVNDFSCACTTASGVVAQHSDPFTLPRVVITDRDGEALIQRLKLTTRLRRH